MSIFDIFDQILETIHEYPHKARHYNKIVLKSIEKYKMKYKKSIKKEFKSAKKSGESTKKIFKYSNKITQLLNSKIDATKCMLEITSSILKDFEKIVKNQDINIDFDVPIPDNTPNIVKIGKLSDGIYCECREAAYGDMIFCDSLKCKIKWFHFKCVGINSVPKGSWYCSDCKKDWRLCRLENQL